VTHSDVPLCLWNSPALLAGNMHICVRYRICGLIQERVYIVQTPVHDTSCCDQPTHGQAYHKTSSTKQLVNGESDYVQAWGKRTSLWTSASLKHALFRANTLCNLLFSESSTVYRGKQVVLPYFYRIHLKAIKVSKSEGTEKSNMCIIFESVLMLLTENYQNWSMLVEATACQSWHIFLSHSVE